jgi:multicomponent Na+:H+ antiporter subunit E
VTASENGTQAVGFASAALARWAGFLCLWLVIFGPAASDLVVGAATAAAATWTSLRLSPPAGARLRPVALARLGLRFFWQSAIAGADVARRALDPALPLRPGFVRCPTRLAPGPRRDAFCALSSLLPGTLPTGSDRGGALLAHCLDVGQDVVAQMAEEEAAFLAALAVRTDG